MMKKLEMDYIFTFPSSPRKPAPAPSMAPGLYRKMHYSSVSLRGHCPIMYFLPTCYLGNNPAGELLINRTVFRKRSTQQTGLWLPRHFSGIHGPSKQTDIAGKTPGF